MPAPPTSPIEVACDESGFTGGNLTIRGTVFAHASVVTSESAAREEMARLRRVVVARGELKASWLLRWCDRDDLTRLLGPDGLLDDGVVHLTDARLFLLCRLVDVMVGVGEISGLTLPGQPPVRPVALRLHRYGEHVVGARQWREFLVASGHVLRSPSRWTPPTPVQDLIVQLERLASASTTEPIHEDARQLLSGIGRLRSIRAALAEDPRSPPLLEPLLPALSQAVRRWGADREHLVVIHDEQSALTPWRVAEIGRRLAAEHPGHTVSLTRVDSQDEPRVQIADLVAGIARRAATGVLAGRADPGLLRLVAPLVDPDSVWADQTWRGRSAVGHPQ